MYFLIVSLSTIHVILSERPALDMFIWVYRHDAILVRYHWESTVPNKCLVSNINICSIELKCAWFAYVPTFSDNDKYIDI